MKYPDSEEDSDFDHYGFNLDGSTSQIIEISTQLSDKNYLFPVTPKINIIYNTQMVTKFTNAPETYCMIYYVFKSKYIIYHNGNSNLLLLLFLNPQISVSIL